MKVLKYPNKKLSKVSTEVADSREIGYIVDQLEETMAEQTWGETVGMAAPQIGIAKRVFIACGEVFINPTIELLEKGGTVLSKEGCYSLEDGKGDYPVTRNKAVHVSWTTPDGFEKSKTFTGFKAKVIQHEFDHLEGRLCNGGE